MADSFKLSRRGEGGLGGGERGDSAGKTSGWSVAVFSVGKGLAHGLGDVLGADAEDIQQLLRFPTAGDATHCKPGHNNARLLAHCRQHGLTKTTWPEGNGEHQNIRLNIPCEELEILQTNKKQTNK